MMIQKILKYVIVCILILNLPTVGLNAFGASVGSLLTYSSYVLLTAYYFLFLRGQPNLWLVYCGISYFLISGLQIFYGTDEYFISEFAKFLILIIFGNEFFKRISKKEMIVVLAIGSASILLNAFVFPSPHGRSSGFYFNPNAAGFVCLFGYALCYAIEKRSLRIFYQIVFSLAGFMTFSRTFLILWVLINLVSLKISIKNAKILVIGAVLFIALLLFGEVLNLGGNRYNTIKGAITSENSADELGEDSRPETWAMFYDEIMSHPIFGGGYGKFQKGGIYNKGTHNLYLLIIGEAGIIPFIIFLVFCIYLLKSSFILFHTNPSLFAMTLVLLLYLTTTHNFYDNQVKLAVTLFLYNQIVKTKQESQISAT